MDTWKAKWTGTPAPRPAAFGAGGGAAAAGAAGDVAAGVSFQAVALKVEVLENRMRYTLAVHEHDGVRVNDTTRLRRGQRIQVTEWQAGPMAIAPDVQPLDLVRVEGLHTKSGSTTPGKVYFNCTSVAVVRSCWSMARDPAFLAAQRPLAQGAGSLVLLTTEGCEQAPTVHAAGLMLSAAAWPLDVVSSYNESEAQLVLRWNYMPIAVGVEDPPLYQVSAKLWSQHCDALMAGAMPPLPTWRALMEQGKHPVPLALWCCLDVKRSNLITRFLEVQVLGVRADLPSHLAQRCPRVSQNVAAAHAPTAAVAAAALEEEGEDVTAAAAAAQVINVSAVGMPADAGAYRYHAMTSEPEAVRDEAAIGRALAGGTALLFAVPKQQAEEEATETRPKKRQQTGSQ